MARAGGNGDTCTLDIMGTFRLSFPTSATVMEVKRQLSLYMRMTEPGRLILYLLPQRTLMKEHRKLASYQIRAGETRSLAVEMLKIGVMVKVLGHPNLGGVIECYEFATVDTFKSLVVAWLLDKVRVQDVGPGDLELSCNGRKLDHGRANLSDYGVKNASWIEVKITKEIVFQVRPPPTSAL